MSTPKRDTAQGVVDVQFIVLLTIGAEAHDIMLPIKIGYRG